MASKDYYETLGVDKTASADEIKTAYRKLAKQYHPDMNSGDEEAAVRFKEINEAYQVLSDDQKRQQYDTFGTAGPGAGPGPGGFGGGGFSGGGFEFGDLGSIFEQMFGGGAFAGSPFGSAGSATSARRGPMQGSSIRVNMRITFDEAAFGTHKEISFQRIETCEACAGKGTAPGSDMHTCARCGGSGRVRQEQRSMFGSFVTEEECPECGGRGVVPDEACKQCKGSGTVRRQARVSVDIPAGIDSGQILTVRGQGNAGIDGGPPGDLLVAIAVKPDKLFERVGYDLLLDLKINMVQASLGEEIEVPTLEGKVRYKVPEGTQSGTVFRLKGKGIQHIGSTRVGDLYVRVEVVVPKRLSEKQKKLLRAFADKTRLQKTEFSKPQERF